MGKDILYLIVVPFVVILGNLLMEWIKGIMAKRAELRKEKQEREQSFIELEKTREGKEIDVLRITVERNQHLEARTDETNRRVEQILAEENKRLHHELDRVNKENHQQRELLTNVLLGFRRLE